MCGSLSAQKVFSGELAARDILLRPPEPLPEFLISSPSQSVFIGRTALLRSPFFWDYKKLVNPHLCVVGITGAGKSYFVKSFVVRANLTLGASVLILDWSGEYSAWVESAGGRVVSLGAQGINLMECPTQTPHTRIAQLLSVLDILLGSQSARQRMLMQDALEQCYRKAGIGLGSAPRRKSRFPTLANAQKILAKKAKRSHEAALGARLLANLLRASKEAFIARTIPISSLLEGMVCIDLSHLGSDEARSLAGLSILQLVKEKMRQNGQSESPKPGLFVVLDEAWKIASDPRSDAVTMVREGRKYGIGLIISSQNPTDVHPTVFSNAGTTVCFRLTSSSERAHVRSSLSYSDYYELQAHRLTVGAALFHLEPSSPTGAPRDFIISRVEGEEPSMAFAIRGGGMDLKVEKGELLGCLVSNGVAHRDASSVLNSLESHSRTVSAQDFVRLLEGCGTERGAIISILRALGASEKEMLSAMSSPPKPGKKAVQLALHQRGGSS